MNEDLKRPEQGSTEVNNTSLITCDPLRNQDLTQFADSPYEETKIPYLPLSEKTQQRSPSAGGNDEHGATPPSSSQPADLAASSPRSSGGGELFGAGVGAILGAALGFMTRENPLLWTVIGAVVGGGIIALLRALFAQEDYLWLGELLEALFSSLHF